MTALDRYLALRDAPGADGAQVERARWAAAWENRGLCMRWIRTSSPETVEDLMQEPGVRGERKAARWVERGECAMNPEDAWWIRCYVRRAYWQMGSTISVAESRADGETLDAIGETLGLSRERVRQLEIRAIEDVRAMLGIQS